MTYYHEKKAEIFFQYIYANLCYAEFLLLLDNGKEKNERKLSVP